MNWKENLPDKVFKIIMAIISILFAGNEYNAHQEHQQLREAISHVEAHLDNESDGVLVYEGVQ